MPQAKRKRTRIQAENEERIVTTALSVFAKYGFRGTTVEQIATAAGMSKANVLYYYKSKADIYLAVLEELLEVWLAPLTDLDAEGDALIEIQQYIHTKLQMSRSHPEASRLYANEIQQGAPVIGPYLRKELKELVGNKITVLTTWMEQGQIKQFEPVHLLFLIWSSTQHYADFATQIKILEPVSKANLYKDAEYFLDTVIVAGLKGPNYSGHFFDTL